MKFPNDRITSEWFRLIPEVQRIAREADAYLENLGNELFVTSIYRTPRENDDLYGGRGDHLYGPHVLYHALDARSHDLASGWKESLEAFLASRWIYDGRRPLMKVMFLESARDVGSTAEHFHFQALPDITGPRLFVDEAPLSV